MPLRSLFWVILSMGSLMGLLYLAVQERPVPECIVMAVLTIWRMLMAIYVRLRYQ